MVLTDKNTPEAANRTVILAEDDPVTLTLAQKMLTEKGYEVIACKDGLEALEYFLQKPVPVVITDIYMPHLSGEELIEKLNQTAQKPVIVVISTEENVHFVLKILRQGVYDYLIKPLKRDEFVYKVDKAFELAHYRELCYHLAQEREILHAQKIDWERWKEILLHRESEKRELNLFQNIKASLSQAAGFGNLLALIPLIPLQSKKEDDFYKVRVDLVELLLDNADTARLALEKIDEISNAISANYDLRAISLEELYNFISRQIEDSEPWLQIKNQTISLAELPQQLAAKEVDVDLHYFELAFKELLLNSCKFSEENSDIKILLEVERDKLHISLISSPTVNKFKVRHIPSGYERHLFEPFFRMHAEVDERYKSLNYGLGLTMVERVLRKMHGSIIARNLREYARIGERALIRINFDIQFKVK
ncbi:MAG: response regulator [Leptospiraceae bacterium]|nr:response regulator [Leptospiraceae bacterium]MDW8307585.1 response regulator [Leptospiraceae bacterium]